MPNYEEDSIIDFDLESSLEEFSFEEINMEFEE